MVELQENRNKAVTWAHRGFTAPCYPATGPGWRDRIWRRGQNPGGPGKETSPRPGGTPGPQMKPCFIAVPAGGWHMGLCVRGFHPQREPQVGDRPLRNVLIPLFTLGQVSQAPLAHSSGPSAQDWWLAGIRSTLGLCEETLEFLCSVGAKHWEGPSWSPGLFWAELWLPTFTGWPPHPSTLELDGT